MRDFNWGCVVLSAVVIVVDVMVYLWLGSLVLSLIRQATGS